LEHQTIKILFTVGTGSFVKHPNFGVVLELLELIEQLYAI